MSNNLQSIMIDLKNAMDDYKNITNIDLVLTAVDRLEVFPMTMLQLQETRIGQILQAIRHKIEPNLQKRIRSIIKAWQKLLQPGSACTTIIPIYADKKNGSSSCHMKEYSTELSSRVDINSQDLTSNHSSNFLNSSDKSRHKIHNENSDKRNKFLIKSNVLTVDNAPMHPNISLTTTNFDLKVEMTKPDSSVLNGSQFSNGQPPIYARYANLRAGIPETLETHSITSDSSNHDRRTSTFHRLAKVKSTAELIESARSCIDSITVDRILSNRITKETDECQRNTPNQSTRVARQTKLNQPISNPNNIKNSVSTATLTCTTPNTSHMSVAKSELMDKFLETTVLHQEQIKNQNPDFCPTQKLAFSETSVVAETSDYNKQKYKYKDKKHKRKIKRRRLEKDNHSSKPHKHNSSVPPITNYMNDWPKLPQLSSNLVYSTTDPADKLSKQILNNKIVSISPPSAYPVEQDNLKLASLTEIYSVDMEDMFVHILPWVNLTDCKKTFFPSDCNDLERLLNLPDPW